MNNKSVKFLVSRASLVSRMFILLFAYHLSRSKTMSFNQEKDSFKSSHTLENCHETDRNTIQTTVSESSSAAHTLMVLEEQQKRQDTLKAKCADISGNNLWDRVSMAKYLRKNARRPRLYYSDKHKCLQKHEVKCSFNVLCCDAVGLVRFVTVCGVPKCASTEWRKALLIVEGDVQATSPQEIGHEYSFTLAMQKRFLWNKFPLSNKNSFNELECRLNAYFLIMTVREPLERVVSAYIDKMIPGGTAVDFYQQLSRRIHKTFAKDKKNFKEGWATFEEFVDSILHNPGGVDIHWQHYSSICDPCNIHYDYIAKLETIAQDSTYIAEKIKINGSLLFDGKDKPRTNSQEKHEKYEKYLRELPKEKLHRLFQLYKTQYELFDYPFPSYVQP